MSGDHNTCRVITLVITIITFSELCYLTWGNNLDKPIVTEMLLSSFNSPNLSKATSVHLRMELSITRLFKLFLALITTDIIMSTDLLKL